MVRNQKMSDESLSDTSSSKYSSTLLRRLESGGKTWGRLKIKAEQSLSTPPALPEVGRCRLTP